MDLIEGIGRKRPLLVLLERKSRYVVAGFLKGKWSEEVVRVGTRLACQRINNRPRKILNKRFPQSLRKHLLINT